MALVSAANGLAFQRRSSTGGQSTHTSGGAGAAPAWVRLVRAGNLFRSYVSEDGTAWTLIGTDTIAMSSAVYVGLAVTSHNTTQLATVSFTDASVAVMSAPLPSPWSRGDVGSPATAGRSSESSGTFSVTGAGTDISNASDQFHFVYQPIAGDVQITARVAGIEHQHAESKAGVMIRESLSAPAAHASMFGTSASGWAFQRRPIEAAVSIRSPGAATPPPGWVRVVRSGGEFSGFESADGVNWTLVGTETIEMPATVYVGLAVTSHNVSAASTATLTSVSLNASALNTPPTVAIGSPANGATFTAPASITITATAADSDGTVSRVDFYQGATLLGTDTTSPFTHTWSNAPAGTYALTARATDDDGAVTTSAVVSVTVAASQPATTLVFNPSADHDAAVDRYTVAIFRAGDPVTATPVATSDLGRPAVVGNEISVNISNIIDPLASGSYYAVVTAVGPGGSSASAPSANFTN